MLRPSNYGRRLPIKAMPNHNSTWAYVTIMARSLLSHTTLPWFGSKNRPSKEMRLLSTSLELVITKDLG